MGTFEVDKTPREITELYCQYGESEKKAMLYGTPFAILAVGSVGIAIKIATGDDALATLYSNKVIAGIHAVGLIAGAPGFQKYVSIEERDLNNLAVEIAQAENRPVNASKDIANNKNRVTEVLRLAGRVSPDRMVLFFNRLHFRIEDLLSKVTHSYTTDEGNAIRQRGDIESASYSKHAFTFLTGATADEIARKALEIGLYRWEKVAWDIRQSHEQRRYAHQMVGTLKRELNS